MIFLKKLIFLIISAILILSAIPSHASVSISAESAIVIENSSGKIIYEKNAGKKMPMASTTKIMTALCVLENLHPAQPVVIDKRSVGIEGSSVYLKEGEVLTVLELLYAMLLNSGNDAATALALAVSDSVEDFAKLMTRTAKKIGASDTNFTNPSGLYDENHYTTAYDLALITSYALKNRQFAQIVAKRTATISGSSPGEKRYLKNHNRLLSSYEGCTGVKTGYTKKCGRCLVSAASRDQTSLTCVTLKAPDDWNDHRALLDYAFSRTTTTQIASAGDYAIKKNIGGVVCRLNFEDSLHAPVIDGKYSSTEIIFDINPDASLPLNAGQTVGTAYLMSEGKRVDKCSLICDKAIVVPQKEKSFANSFWENLRKLFK